MFIFRHDFMYEYILIFLKKKNRERSEDVRQEQERKLDEQSSQIKDLLRRVIILFFSYQMPQK